MATFAISRLLPLLARYGYAVILPIAVIEGPAMAMVAGALAAAGELNPYSACILLILADLVGDALYYGLGRFGHGPLLGQIGSRPGLTENSLAPPGKRFHTK